MRLRTRTLSSVMLAFFVASTPLQGDAFSQFRKSTDVISTSATGAAAGHEITVTLSSDIPPGGSFVVDFAGSAPYEIVDGFSYTDVDFAVATSSVFSEYSLGATSTATTSIVSVASGDNGSVAITLGTDAGLRVASGSRVRVRLGPSARDGYSGMWPIMNPLSEGPALVRVRTENAVGDVVDRADMLNFILNPIAMTTIVEGRETVMSNPLPKGLLPGSTSKVYMSLETDLPAYCKWSLVENEPYANRLLAVQKFKSKNVGRHHYLIIDTVDNTHYTYYVRCFTIYGKVENAQDLKIDFEVGMTPTEPRPPAPPPKPPGTENGSGAGGGNKQLQAGVTIAGKVFPGAQVVILKDGKEYARPSVSGDGAWTTVTQKLDRGTYSFSISATDVKGLSSARFNATLAVNPNTSNTIGPVYMSPTLSVVGSRIEPGQKTVVAGSAIPSEEVQVVVLTPSDPLQMPLLMQKTTVRGDGSWTLTLPTESFVKGTYNVKAQSLIKGKGASLFSADYLLGVGETPKGNAKGRADLNKDGKVNIMDLSIMLSKWGQPHPVADLNGNGRVDISDLSILLSAWTG